MTNREVIISFMNGKVAKSSTGNLYSNGDRLFNYQTCIAEHTGNGKVIVNSTKYSVTTSKLQTYVRYEADRLKGGYIEVTGVQAGRQNLSRYVK